MNLPAGVFEAQGYLFYTGTDQATIAWLNARCVREFPIQWKLPEGGLPVEEPEMPKPSIIEKAASFVSAVTSGQTDEETFQKRLAICKGCTKLQTSSKGLFCGACGCGDRKLAELHTKLRFNRVKCPLRKLP